jgi:hypothetical protein
MTEQLAGATRREMRQLVDECVSEFSDRVENMFANFENRLGAKGSTLAPPLKLLARNKALVFEFHPCNSAKILNWVRYSSRSSDPS